MALLYTLEDGAFNPIFGWRIFEQLIQGKILHQQKKYQVILTHLTPFQAFRPILGPNWPLWSLLVRGKFHNCYYRQRRFDGPVLQVHLKICPDARKDGQIDPHQHQYLWSFQPLCGHKITIYIDCCPNSGNIFTQNILMGGF